MLPLSAMSMQDQKMRHSRSVIIISYHDHHDDINHQDMQPHAIHQNQNNSSIVICMFVTTVTGNTTVFHGRCSLFHNWKLIES